MNSLRFNLWHIAILNSFYTYDNKKVGGNDVKLGLSTVPVDNSVEYCLYVT
ncbi:hypothetical protein C427_3196 [Paraglaciecola psychrophila 170]|uniref:Uncharacterized protein n=1 Tax=Paraglaciecola psychrophila 170 TaxID=1129794 RepID=M4RNS3_9ALTE|nr:hypothetical protein C427_3196 [Paraglaciecola psychrophila 170]